MKVELSSCGELPSLHSLSPKARTPEPGSVDAQTGSGRVQLSRSGGGSYSASPRCALNRTEPEGQPQLPWHNCQMPTIWPPPDSAPIVDHTVRGRSVSFSPRLKTSYSIFTDSSLFTICEVRYSRHSMKRYDKCNVKFNLKYNLILLLNGLLNVQYLCFYNWICLCDIYFEHLKNIGYTNLYI